MILPAPEKILILQPRRIGDVIVTTPVIDVLRRAYPEAHVDFLVERAAQPVLYRYPGLREVLVFDKSRFFYWVKTLRARRYDWVLDFMNNPRTAQLAWLSGAPVRAGFEVPFWGQVYTHKISHATTTQYIVQEKLDLLRALGLPTPSSVLPRLPLFPEDSAGAESWWKDTGLKSAPQRIALAPAHRHPVRQWPVEHFRAALKRLLTRQDRAAVLFGGPGEESLISDLAKDFPGRAFPIPSGPLRQAAALLARCQVLLTNDSGTMHWGVGVGVPTVTIYGPSTLGSWNPQVPPHRALYAQGLSCLGCNRDRCPYDHECMTWVTPAQAAKAVEEILTQKVKP